MPTKGYRYVLLLVITLLIGCKSKDIGLLSKNYSFIYNPTSSLIHPRYSIYHKSNDISYLVLRVYTQEVLLNKANPEDVLQGKLKVHYQVYESLDKGLLVDSSTQILKVSPNEQASELVSYLPIKGLKRKEYHLLVATTDLQKKTTHRDYLLIDKRVGLGQQYFRAISGITKRLLVENYLTCEDSIFVSSDIISIDSFRVEHYPNIVHLPFSPSENMEPLDKLMPDSIWYWNVSNSKLFCAKKEGIYLLKPNSATNTKGFCLLNYGEGFPAKKSAKKLLEPLGYIANEQEMDQMMQHANPKMALDEFWLRHSNNMDEARERIRIYFNRVFFANYYFTTHKEGWKTDRGMIFVVYGPPEKVFKSDTGEVWVYGKKKSFQLEFTFYRKEHSIFFTQYTLDRSGGNITRWKEAIQTWRKGEIYSVDQFY